MNSDILITTTEGIIGPLMLPLELKGMTEDEGAHFLIRRARIAPHTNHFVQAKELSRLVEGLPLALDQAGAYIERTKKSLFDYIQNYRVRLNERGQNATGRHLKTVAATLSFSFEQVKQENPIAAAILQLCAFLNAEAIPEGIFMDTMPRVVYR